MVENIDIALSNILYAEINSFSFSKVYTDIYSNYDERLKNIFSYLHQNLNDLITFMNDKSKSNHHYNAEESRKLLFIIATIEELKLLLEKTNLKFNLNDDYNEFLKYCETFLSSSGGSEIPEDYKKFTTTKYDPIFRMNNDVIVKPNTCITNLKLKLVGEGAFANVFLYTDEFYNEKFAIKKLKSNVDDKEKIRFKNEFETMNKIKHPYILKVYTYNEKDNSYIMEYCNYTLKKYYELHNGNENKLTFEKRKRIALQFLEALTFLHSNGILHRDISWNNILLKEYEEDFIVVKISDFGLIKEENSDLTSTGSEIKGTIIDDTLISFKDYNIKNEIYVIGIMLFYIFTGKYRLTLDDSLLSNVIKKCVDREHKNRYNNVNEIINEIEMLKNSNEKLDIIFEQKKHSQEFILDKLAVEMLNNAAEGNGKIQVIRSLLGTMVNCGRKHYNPQNAKEESGFEYSLKMLIDNQYIVETSDKKGLFIVTRKGFNYYDNSKKVGNMGELTYEVVDEW